jgi:hypothetical protein
MMQKKLAQHTRVLRDGLTPLTAKGEQTGFLLYGQWDGRTYPNVQWALDVTRQSTLEIPFVVDELQLQLLLPTKNGPASKPSFTAYDALSRNFFLTTDSNGFTGQLFGVTVAANVSNVTYTYPRTVFSYSTSGTDFQTMVGLETVYLNGQGIVLVFLQNGQVMKVDPTSGASTPFASLCNNTRQVNAVTYRENTRQIFLLTQSSLNPEPDYAFVTFDYATLATTESIMQIVPYFVAKEEAGFEMVWSEGLQNLIVAFTGNFVRFFVTFSNAYISSTQVSHSHDSNRNNCSSTRPRP